MSYLRNLTLNLVIPPAGGTTQSLYIGTLSVLLFFTSLYAFRRNPMVVFFWGLFACSLLAAFPYPLFWLMHQLPIFELFRFPPHWFFVSSFAMAMLAALGLEYTLYASSGFLKFLGQLMQKRAVALTVLLILVLNFAIPARFLIAQNSLPSERLMIEPWVAERIGMRERETDSFRTYQLYASEMSWRFVVGPFQLTREAAYDFGREYTQTHLMPLLWHVDSIRGFDNFVTRRYARILAFLERYPLGDVVRPNTFESIEESRISLPEGTFALLGMMNVKYVTSITPLAEKHLEEDATLLEKSHFSPLPVPIHLYANNRFLPRIYAPESITMLPENEETFTEIIETPHDFTKIGFIECDCEKRESVPQGTTSISRQEFRNDEISFVAAVSTDAWIIISNSFVPGWVARIDGNPVPLRYANYIYQGIRVPTGVHDVRIEYHGPYTDLLK